MFRSLEKGKFVFQKSLSESSFKPDRVSFCTPNIQGGRDVSKGWGVGVQALQGCLQRGGGGPDAFSQGLNSHQVLL